MVNRKKKQKKKLHKQQQRLRDKEQLKPSLDFPFLASDNEITIKHIAKSKTMFILRGLPGSGKSTVVHAIRAKYKHNSVVCSADDYFLSDGVYSYDAGNLPSAHNQCQQNASQACESGKNIVIIDNTNVRRWEMKFYLNLAERCGYTVVLVMPKTEWRFNPGELAKRNKHEVSLEILETKVSKFEQVIPYYYGWFLSVEQTDRLMAAGRKWLDICVDKYADFRRTLSQLKAPLIKEDPSETGDSSYFSLYSRGERSSSPLHCTSFFCGRSRQSSTPPSVLSYHDNDVVQKSIGQVFVISVIGFTITPRTIGARIKLSPRQLQLWRRDEEDQSHLACCASYETKSMFHPTCGAGSRAHFTLGFSAGSKAVQTGLDQLDVIGCEKQDTTTNQPGLSFPEGVVQNYGQSRLAVYLNEPIKMSALFSGCY